MTELELPFQGRTRMSRHSSYTGAVQASPDAQSKRERYLALLTEHGPVTDNDAAAALGIH
jgi:hypothetical protein